jgi:hypothetical protein
MIPSVLVLILMNTIDYEIPNFCFYFFVNMIM